MSGNVLVLGNSGVGKSTLINAVLGDDLAETGFGTKGTTKELKLFESERLSFRLIDSVGFEPDLFKRMKAINSVRDWCKTAAKAGVPNSAINVIWFCVDGTSRKLFPQAIDSLIKSVSVFRSVPVIVVITKSYSVPDREANIQMVENAFKKTRKRVNLVKILPVVAEIYHLNETAFAPQEGISELINVTNAVMPEGVAAAEIDIDRFNLSRKNSFAHGLIGTSTAAGATVGAVPIPFKDAVILSAIEMAEVNGLAKIYEIKKSDQSHALLQKIIEVGTVSAVARAACGAIINAVPVAGSVVNAAVAGSFVAAIGEGTRFAFEQIYLGNKSIEDIEWVEKVLSEKLSGDFADKVKGVVDQLNDKSSKGDVVKAIGSIFDKGENKNG